MNLPEQFKINIAKEDLFHPKDTLLIAVSGGLDSVVLCELCRQSGYDFSIAHCNFTLRGGESDRDEQFVKKLAQQYGVEYFTKIFDTIAIARERKTGIEETARELRYEWFSELTGDQFAYVLTAHHADDNVETILMNFFRGTGIDGMRGIMPKRGKLIRPLLFARRQDLELFAQQNNLAFVTDSTNADNNYTRNFFRNELLPSIEKVFPEVRQNIINNARRNRGVAALYKEALQHYAQKLLHIKGNEVHIPVLKLAKTKPIMTVTYELTRQYGFTPNQLEDIVNLLGADNGKYVQSPTHRVIRNRKWLIIAPNQNAAAQHILVENDQVKVEFGKGELLVRKMPWNIDNKINTQNDIVQVDAAVVQFPLLLRKWKQGDYFYPLGMRKKKKLSRFFIDNKLSLTEKEQVWVLESNKKIIWVLGMRIDDRFKIQPSTTSVIEFRIKS